MDNRVIFHFNKASLADPNLPPWTIKARGQTHYVWHLDSEVGFSTKETPNNPHTKGSIQFRGTLVLFNDNGRLCARLERP